MIRNAEITVRDWDGLGAIIRKYKRTGKLDGLYSDEMVVSLSRRGTTPKEIEEVIRNSIKRDKRPVKDGNND